MKIHKVIQYMQKYAQSMSIYIKQYCISNYQRIGSGMESFDFQFCSFLKVTQDEADFVLYLYLFMSQPHIYLKHSKQGQNYQSRFDSLDDEQYEQSLQIVTQMFANQHKVDIESVEMHELHLILQLNLDGSHQTLIVPLNLVEKVVQDFQEIENMQMIKRQHYFLKERQEMLKQIMHLREIIENNESGKNEIENPPTKHEDLEQLRIFRRRYKRLSSKCLQLNLMCNQLRHRLKLAQDTINIMPQSSEKIDPYQKQAQTKQVFSTPQGKRNQFLVHHYKEYTKIARIEQGVNIKGPTQQNQICTKGSYNNQFADYFQSQQQLKLTLTSDGYNQFIFEPFTLGKYIGCFQVRDRNIKFRQKSDIYYHITSFQSIPLQGKTRVGFQIVQMSANNIIVGAMLAVRKRFRYCYQQANVISYKVKGGKYALYIDGLPEDCKCESVKAGQCIWMIINRQDNSIAFQKEGTLVKKMPERFMKASLFPFITMKDQGDQIRII